MLYQSMVNSFGDLAHYLFVCVGKCQILRYICLKCVTLQRAKDKIDIWEKNFKKSNKGKIAVFFK